MVEMIDTIVPKSDQLNADDLIGGRTLTIKIKEVTIKAGEQPVALHYEGDNGKPYKPGKSMCRVLVNSWGPDARNYVGRSLTLYCDPTVKFGGIAVGGLRISHMSHIHEPITMALTASKASRKPFTVQPMVVEAAPSLQEWLDAIAKCATIDALKAKFGEAAKAFKDSPDFAKIHDAKEKRKGELTNASN